MAIPQVRTFTILAAAAIILGFSFRIAAQDSRHVAPRKPDTILNDSKTAPAGAIYGNEEIGISFPIPEGWIILGDTFRSRVRVKGKELYDDSPEPQRKRIDEAMDRTGMEFAVMEPGTPNRRSSNLLLMTEHVPEGSILSLRTYYDAVLATMQKSSKVSIEVLEPLTAKRVGNKLCGFYKLRVETEELTFWQRYLMFIRGRTAVVLLLNYYDESGGELFNKIIATVEID